MPKKDYTHITFVIDRSGSMVTMKDEAQNSFNQFIKDQKKLPGKLTVTLVQFDNKYEVVWNARNAKKVGKYTLTPRGGTALLDAIGQAVASTGEYLRDLSEDARPDKVMFGVLTDGCENASQEFTGSAIKEMVEHQTEKYSWEFNFLAANQDAILGAGQMGIHRSNAMNFAATGRGIASAMCAYSTGADNYRRGLSANIGLADVASDEDSQNAHAHATKSKKYAK